MLSLLIPQQFGTKETEDESHNGSDDDGGKKEGRWRRLLAARQPGKKESESVDLHARRFFINKVLTPLLSLSLSLPGSLILTQS